MPTFLIRAATSQSSSYPIVLKKLMIMIIIMIIIIIIIINSINSEYNYSLTVTTKCKTINITSTLFHKYRQMIQYSS